MIQLFSLPDARSVLSLPQFVAAENSDSEKGGITEMGTAGYGYYGAHNYDYRDYRAHDYMYGCYGGYDSM